MTAVSLKALGQWLRVAFGLGLLCVLIVYVDPGKVATAVVSVDLGWLTVVALFLTFATLLGAANLNLMISRGGELPLWRFLPIYWTSWAFSLVVPGQVGDMLSLPILLKRHGLKWSSSLGRALVDKLMSLLVMAVLGLIGVSVYLEASWRWPELLLWGALGAALLVLGLVLIMRHQSDDNSLFSRLKRGFVNTLLEALRTVRLNPGRVVVNFVLTWIKVGLTGIAFWAMFRALGSDSADLLDVLPLMAASALIAYLPISFNGLGTVELAGIILFSTLGLDEPVIVSAYVMLRGLNMILAWAPASLWLLVSRRDTQ